MPVIAPVTRPTMYFIGVTTTQSSMMRIFPAWARLFGVDAVLVGHDLPPGAPAAEYRAIVQHVKDDPQVLGALVTTHKIDLLAASRDLFDTLDAYAEALGEISSISKDDDRLIGQARDPISSREAWHAFVPHGHWAQHPDAEVLCLGGGGAAAAISVFANDLPAADRPARFDVVEVSPARLDHIQAIHQRMTTALPFAYHHSRPGQAGAQDNDARLAALPAGSLVINATGLGKDRPGSPLTDAAIFPLGGLAWELNYRGALGFLQQAQQQAAARGLIVEDGWTYFVHGWSQVVAEVFHHPLTPPLFHELDMAARTGR